MQPFIDRFLLLKQPIFLRFFVKTFTPAKLLGLPGLSVCKWSENFNENSEIIFLTRLLGVFQDYGKQFQTLPSRTKIKDQQIGNLTQII